MSIQYLPLAQTPDTYGFLLTDAPAFSWLTRITWDEEEGFKSTDHGFGYVQHSRRPYILGYGCDGTTDGNIHLLAIHICEHFGLDYVSLLSQVISHPDAQTQHDRIVNSSRLYAETLFPLAPNREAVILLLRDLNAINNRMFCEVLAEAFIPIFGEDMLFWWQHLPETKPAISYRYRIANRQQSSARLGNCECCGEYANDVFLQVEEREYSFAHNGEKFSGWTRQECKSLFGRETCLRATRRGIPTQTTSTDKFERTYED